MRILFGSHFCSRLGGTRPRQPLVPPRMLSVGPRNPTREGQHGGTSFISDSGRKRHLDGPNFAGWTLGARVFNARVATTQVNRLLLSHVPKKGCHHRMPGAILSQELSFSLRPRARGGVLFPKSSTRSVLSSSSTRSKFDQWS